MSKLLGADPELLILDRSGERHNAGSVIPNYIGAFGVDGSGIAAEVRPRPCDNPAELIRNIRAALIAGYEEIAASSGADMWLAGTGREGNHATGGHLHLGIEQLSEGIADAYIGVPLIAMEPSHGRRWRRTSGGYGEWGDIRQQSWGLEYRTPSSWLVSPATARIAAALAWLVAVNYDKLPEVNWLGDIYDCFRRNARRDDSTTTSLQLAARKVLATLSTLPGYKEVAGMLDPYYFIAEVVGDWGESRNLVDTWRLRGKKDPNPPLQSRDEGEAEHLREGAANAENALIWNKNDLHILDTEQQCGTVQAKVAFARLWVVGAKRKRGSRILLSPALASNKQVRMLLRKHKLSACAWPNFPARNGELVIGLPLKLRRDAPDKAGMVTRLIALAAFDRLISKKG